MSIRDEGGFRDIIRRGAAKVSAIPHHDHDATDVSGVFNFLRALAAKITGNVEIEGDIVLTGTMDIHSQLFVHTVLQHINLFETDAGDYPDKVFIMDINSGIGRLFWFDAPSSFTEGLEIHQNGTVKVKVGPFLTNQGTAAAPAHSFDAAPSVGMYHDAGTLGFGIGGVTVGGFTADGLNPFGGGVPIGAVFPYVGTTAPTGYLLCQGQAVSRTTYSKLFALTGTAFGAGDGSTTFNVPDLRGRFPIGVAAAGTGSTRGGTGGNIDHTHTGPSHTHTLGSHTHAISGTTGTVSANHTHAFNVNTGTMSAGGFAAAGGVHFAGDHVHNAAGNTGTISANHTHSFSDTSGGPSADSGAAGTGATGTANPPFQAFHYIVRSQA